MGNYIYRFSGAKVWYVSTFLLYSVIIQVGRQLTSTHLVLEKKGVL